MTTRIDVRYDPNTKTAILDADAPGEAWDEIARLFDDIAFTETEGLLRLRVPWWVFLRTRLDLADVLDAYAVKIEFEAESRALLEQAAKNQEAFLAPQLTPPLTQGELDKLLERVGFIRTLTAEQNRNVAKLLTLPSGASFSVPGAGKTSEALAWYFASRSTSSLLLVVAPKNAFGSWESELLLNLPSMRDRFVRLVGGQNRIKSLLAGRPSLMLVTYHQLNSAQDVISEYLSSLDPKDVYIFSDESHRIKGGVPKPLATAVINLSHFSTHKLILSGTPMPNDVSDLVPQFQFLYPEIFTDDANVRSLAARIFVRTTKVELGLPPLFQFISSIDLSPIQAEIYELVRFEERRRAQANLGAEQSILLRSAGKSAMRLLQLVSNPSLLSASGLIEEPLLSSLLDEGDSPKIAFACERARELAAQGRKVLIWSTFVSNVELIARRLRDLGAVYIHGGVDAGSDEEEDTREYRIKQFMNDSTVQVLVANPAACGEGINLHTSRHYAIYVDRNYNAAQFLQSEDRIHRLGLSRDQLTYVEILVCPNTIDVSVDLRLRDKVRRMGLVLDDPGLNVDPISFRPEDINSSERMDRDDVNALLEHLSGDQ